MIRLENICLSFASQEIFNNISWHIRPADRIGLVGPNGTGKTTMLRVLLKKQLIDSGKIQQAKAIQTGYLPQETMFFEGKTLLEETLSVYQSILEMEREIFHLQKQISNISEQSSGFEQLMNRLGYLQNRFEHADGYRIEFEAKKILHGLGFQEQDKDKQTSTFSGGWQMRISLAKLLLLRPELLILDEPTNHLDLKTTEWLENYLLQYDGAFIIVSHDRYFLDRTVKKIASLERGELLLYSGSYSFYEREQKKRVEMLWKEYLGQKDEIARISKFIERFRYKATKAAQVQSRIKKLAKIKRIHPPEQEVSVNFHFPPAPASGKLMLEVENLSKSYDNKQVLSDLSFRCDRGDRIALVGVNGAGKSTLCRILAGFESNNQGKIYKDARFKVGYYSQEVADQLNSEKKVLEETVNKAGNYTPNQVRNVLGGFLFRGDDVSKQIRVLSGGEKSRLALACLLFQSANFLILDEPTNHLDKLSKVVLYEALKFFDGTIVLVSHDRFFINKIANRVIEISDGKLRQFWGNYTDYLHKKELEEAETFDEYRSKTEFSKKPDEFQNVLQKKSKTQKRLEAEERNRRSRLIKEQKIRMEKIESKIEKLESKKEKLEQKMADPATFQKSGDIKVIQIEFHQTVELLQKNYRDWDVVAEEIDKISSDFGE